MRQLSLGFFSVRGLLGRSAKPSKADTAGRIEHIRQAMLSALGDADDNDLLQTANKVRYASDAQGLWYLRGELMETLANLHGEVSARRDIEQVSALFAGLLPRGLASRISSLQMPGRIHH